MRYLRLFAILLFLGSLFLFSYSGYRYRKGLNADMPVLKSDTEVLELSVSDPAEAIFRGLTATDATDGDLTDKIMVASTSHFLEPGTVNVKYVVFDRHHNSTTLTRKVCYTDYISPVFSLDKAPIYLRGDNFDLLDHITVTDCLDGDISGKLRLVSGAVSNYSVGTYPVMLEVYNSYGDAAQLQVLVTYLDKSQSTASIVLSDYVDYVDQGVQYDPSAKVLAVTDSQGNALDKSLVTLEGNLDTSQPGFYPMLYSYDDGNFKAQTCMTIVVKEATP